MRLEVSGDATHLDVEYHTATDELGYRGAGAGTAFDVWRGGRRIDEQPGVVGRGRVRLAIRADCIDGDGAIAHLPEGMKPSIITISGIGGEIEPAPPQPRWLAYGDSIVEGWIASGPAGAWPAIAARRHSVEAEPIRVLDLDDGLVVGALLSLVLTVRMRL